MARLTPKQMAFCREHVLDNNGAQAAIRAGYSKRTAKSQASRLLTNVNVQALIAKLTAKVEAKALWSAQEIAEKIQELAADALAAGDRAQANRSLELLGKIRAMFTEKTQLSGPGDEPLDLHWKVTIVRPGDKLPKKT